MIKLGTVLAAGTFFVLTATQISYSADMAVAPAPIATACPGGPFSGFWAGGNLDWAYYRAERNDEDAFLFKFNTQNSTANSAGGGVAGGWDWQCRNRVFGVVADLSWTRADTVGQVQPNAPGVIDLSVNSHLNWYGTLRTRGGLTIDNILIYLTGGLAYANIDTTWNQVSVPPNVSLNNHLRFSSTPFGLAAGVGVETMLWDRWSLKSELLYLQFQEKTFSGTIVPAGTPTTFSFRNNDSVWVSRLAMQYRF